MNPWYLLPAFFYFSRAQERDWLSSRVLGAGYTESLLLEVERTAVCIQEQTQPDSLQAVKTT